MADPSVPENDLPSRVGDWRLRILSVNEAQSRVALLVTADPSQSLAIDGKLSGPKCVYARTIAVDHRFQPARSSSADPASYAFAAVIDEACLWEPIHPFLYEGAWRLDEATVPLSVGVRSLAVRANVVWLNGQPFQFRGLSLAWKNISDERLREFHDWKLSLLSDPSLDPWHLRALATRTDRFGPFVTGSLPASLEEAVEIVRSCAPMRPSIGIWLTDQDWSADDFRKLREQDPWTLFARVIEAGGLPTTSPADLLWIAGSREEVLACATTSPLPWIGEVRVDEDLDSLDAEGWNILAGRLDGAFASAERCVGWIAAHGSHNVNR